MTASGELEWRSWPVLGCLGGLLLFVAALGYVRAGAEIAFWSVLGTAAGTAVLAAIFVDELRAWVLRAVVRLCHLLYFQAFVAPRNDSLLVEAGYAAWIATPPTLLCSGCLIPTGWYPVELLLLPSQVSVVLTIGAFAFGIALLLRMPPWQEEAGEPDPHTLAEARRLLVRLSEGRVTDDQLALAAYLGHPPARAALGKRVYPDTRIAGLREEWRAATGIHPNCGRVIPAIDHWGREAAVRATVAATRLVSQNHERLRAACSLLEAWVTSPTALGEAAIDQVRAELERDTAMGCAGGPLGWAGEAMVFATQTVTQPAQHAAAQACAMNHLAGAPGRTELEAQALVQEAIRAELIPWAIGTGE